MTCSRRLGVALVICVLGAAGLLQAGSLADPMRPYSVARAPQGKVISEFSVTAVFRSDERQVAIVNGKVVKVGDRLADIRIVQILPDGVRYERGGRLVTIHIASQTVKVRSSAANTAASQEVSP